jgi:hypothetical protein
MCFNDSNPSVCYLPTTTVGIHVSFDTGFAHQRLTRHRADTNVSNLSVCKFPTSTVYILVLLSSQALCYWYLPYSICPLKSVLGLWEANVV